jgi:organic hydroperoxide reductase OsmC/OhrA
MTGRRLLIVDDEAAFAAFVRRVAGDLGFEVEVTTSGADFMDAYGRFQPDVVTVDMVMPGQDGLSLVGWLMEIGSTARIIIMSGFNPGHAAMAQTIAAERRAAPIMTLQKPVSVAELRRVLLAGQPEPAALATSRQHQYAVTVTWTGNLGPGTSGYRDYARAHEISAPEKPVILGSSDPAFRGNSGRWNPEELLVASVSACHKLWYLHLAAEAGIVVTAYVDAAEGVMEETPDGGGRFVSVTLRPRVVVSRGDRDQARALHEAAHAKCFIANSVKFDIDCVPEIVPAPS